MSEKIKEAADKYTSQAWFDLEYSTFGNTAKECQKAFEAGAEFMSESANAKIAKLTEALEYYAKHESVIKEAYQTDSGQLVVVHTFINHVAKEALKSCEQYDEQTEEKT